MDAPNSPKSAAVDDRRRGTRRESAATLHVRFETDRVGGLAENISAAGVFFFSPDRVRVSIEVVDNGQSKTYTGRIVRMEPVSDANTGFAIEFDRA